MERDLGHLREAYERGPLRRRDLAPDPIVQFGRWFDAWADPDRYDTAACLLATADGRGRPSARYVLCRSFGPDGFVVYTNLESRKARDLAENPWGAITFGWLDQQRQVRVEGPVTPVEDEVADAYWETRPRSSRIGAWASDQSEVVADREELDRRVAEATERFGADEGGGPVPRPPMWGGLRVGIDMIEFWQGRPDRLHDRFRYRRPDGTVDTVADRAGPGADWVIERLAP